MPQRPIRFDDSEQALEDTDRLRALESEAARALSIALSPEQLAHLALILNGSYQPLRGYMTEADYDAVLSSLTLADGEFFPLPVVLDVDMTTARSMQPGARIALRDGRGAALALLTVDDVWRRDSKRESQLLGLDENAYGRRSCYLGGRLQGIRLPAHPFFAELRPTPTALKRRIRERGFNRVMAVQLGSLIHRQDHEIVSRAAAELDAAILLLPAIGAPDPAHTLQVATIKSHLALMRYLPPKTALMALLDYPVRNTSLRGYLMQALLRKRYGATHFIMRGITQSVIEADPRLLSFLKALDLEAVVWPQRRFSAWSGELKEEPLNQRTDTEAEHVALAERIRRGDRIPDGEFVPEVAAILQAHYRPRKRNGFTLFFTGLSGSGKSTLAKIVQARIAERDPRTITLLDGDGTRKQFSKGAGIFKQDRDTDVRRIGAAAADITKAGGVAICCPIAPYAETRKAVRAIIEPHGPMIEIHVATPLEVCEQRDPGGLYKQAREGRIPDFTGIDAPYEAPISPDIRVDASEDTPTAAADEVIAYLERTALVATLDS